MGNAPAALAAIFKDFEVVAWALASSSLGNPIGDSDILPDWLLQDRTVLGMEGVDKVSTPADMRDDGTLLLIPFVDVETSANVLIECTLGIEVKSVGGNDNIVNYVYMY